MTDRTCSIDGCESPVCKRGWCNMHYQRWRTKGDPTTARRYSAAPPRCAVEGCDQTPRSRGWCWTHYLRWRRHGNTGSTEKIRYPLPPKCSVDGCDGLPHGRGLCGKHYDRWLKYGDPDHLEGVAPGGDRVGYGAVHFRLRKQRGRAADRDCQHCGMTAAEWAYTHDASDERRDEQTGMTYTTDLNRYIPLCVSCHQKFDWNQRQVA